MRGMAPVKPNFSFSRISGKHVVLAAAGVAGIVFAASAFTVPSGTVGVESLFGEVRETYYGPGFHMSNPLTRITLYDIRVQNTQLKAPAVTADGLSISSNITVRWRLDAAHAVETRRTVAGNVETTILQPMLVDAITRATSKFGVSSLFDAKTRAEIGQIVTEMLHDRCGQYGVIILDVMVNQLQPPESVERAVHQKMTAEQDAARANYVMDKQRIELAFETERAQFEADRNMMLARAEAERLKLLAASEAERSLLLAKADAERRKLEADGISAFQRAIDASTSTRVLEWRKIEAAQVLYANPNLKFAFVDPKQPMLLNMNMASN